MRHAPVCLLAILSVLALSATVGAQEVYQWKDASGVTHYSQTPPANGQYQQRAITQHGAAAPQMAAQEPVAQENQQCKNARANLAMLQGSGAVHQAGADGKPGRALTEAERASQTELAQAAIKAYCPQPDAR